MSHSMQLHYVADEIVHEWNGERKKNNKIFLSRSTSSSFSTSTLNFHIFASSFSSAHKLMPISDKCTHSMYAYSVLHNSVPFTLRLTARKCYTDKTYEKKQHRNENILTRTVNSVHRARNVLSTPWCEWGSLRMYWSTLIFFVQFSRFENRCLRMKETWIRTNGGRCSCSFIRLTFLLREKMFNSRYKYRAAVWTTLYICGEHLCVNTNAKSQRKIWHLRGLD